MGTMKMLKTGDPCPICGEPIHWKDPQILKMLSRAFRGELVESELEDMLELMDKERMEETGNA